jgi:hypothetical protein
LLPRHGICRRHDRLLLLRRIRWLARKGLLRPANNTQARREKKNAEYHAGSAQQRKRHASPDIKIIDP